MWCFARTEFAELAVGQEEGTEGPEAIQGFVAMLLSSALVHWGIGKLRVATSEVLRLPDEILQQISVILGEKQDLGLFDDVT